MLTETGRRKSGRGGTSAALLASVFLVLPWLLFACSGSGTTGSSRVIDIGDNNPGVVLAAGDSVTWGTDSPGNRGYRDELERLLGEQGKAVTVINGGRPSARSFHIGETNAELWRTRPAVLILQFGLNDSLVIHDDTPRSIVDNLRHMIYAGLDNKTIVVLTTLNPVCGYREKQNGMIRLANEGLRELAAGFEADFDTFVLADVGAAFAEKDPEGGGCALVNTSSYNHPTVEGYNLMAAVIAAALDPLDW